MVPHFDLDSWNPNMIDAQISLMWSSRSEDSCGAQSIRMLQGSGTKKLTAVDCVDLQSIASHMHACRAPRWPCVLTVMWLKLTKFRQFNLKHVALPDEKMSM